VNIVWESPYTFGVAPRLAQQSQRGVGAVAATATAPYNRSDEMERASVGGATI
jgi:hypothetical protein